MKWHTEDVKYPDLGHQLNVLSAEGWEIFQILPHAVIVTIVAFKKSHKKKDCK